jgi:hypothetical protein
MEGKRVKWTGLARKIDGQKMLVVRDGEKIMVFVEGREVMSLPSPPATLAGIKRALSRP